MSNETQNEETLLSPWAHPKAQKWFQDLFHRSGFIRDLEDELQVPTELVSMGRTRLLMAILIILGRPGIWPPKRQKLLQMAGMKVSRKLNEPAEKRQSAEALTIAEYNKRNLSLDAMKEELEMLRRRAGISNRKNPLPAPSTWSRFWDQSPNAANRKQDSLDPWHDEDGQKWLFSLQTWRDLTRLVRATLELEPRQYPHEIRAAAALIILLCRDGLWPFTGVDSQQAGEQRDDASAQARRQMTVIKGLFQNQLKFKPELASNQSYRQLLESMDEEMRILDSKVSESQMRHSNEPPKTWGLFWCG